MKFLYFLRPKGAVYIQDGIRDGLMPHSDTISAALISLWPQIDRSAEVAVLAQSPPFRVSSAMPWVTDQNGRRQVLLPVPVKAAALGKDAEGDKALKKIAYADAACLRNLLFHLLDLPRCVIWDGDFLITTTPGLENSSRFASRLDRTRLSVNRLSDGPLEGLLFDSREWSFAANCGWALAAECEPDANAKFLAALKLLGFEGLGSDRSSGLGQFEVIEGPVAWDEPDLGSGARMLISLCRPSPDDISRGILNGSYKLTERSGWITAPGARSLRRGRVRMLTEGSWYPDGPGHLPGSLIKVQDKQPDLGLMHPVFRDGRALTISIRLRDKQ